MPNAVEPFTLAVIIELRREDSLDVLGIGREDHTATARGGFDGVWIGGVAVGAEILVPEVKLAELPRVFDAFI